MKEARDMRFADVPLGELPSGGVEKKVDLRCAKVEERPSGLRTGLNEADESLLDFSARALILCAIPPPTLIFFVAITESVLEWVSHGPDSFRGPDCSGGVSSRTCCWDADLLSTDSSGLEGFPGLEGFRGKKGMIGDLETDTDIGMAS